MGMTDAQIDAKMEVVKPEDHGLIRDVLRLIDGMDFCSSYVITTALKGYEITGWIKAEEVLFDNMELIQQVNELRVRCVGVKLPAGGNRMCLRIRVIAHAEPCMVNETILFKAKKRSRWA